MFTCNQCGYTTEIKSNYTRHCKRKTGCTPTYPTVNVDISHDIVSVNDDINGKNVSTSTVDVDKGYVVVDNDTVNNDNASERVQCLKCERVMFHKWFITHQTHHCKGVPRNTCPVCLKQFQCRTVLSRHHKTCKFKLAKKEEQTTTLITNSPQTNITNTNSHNQQTIHTNSHNNTVNNHICIRFGNENLEYIKQMREIDERVDMVIRCLSDVVDYVYFNADRPENQTVRKMNKKSDLIETRLNKDEWEQDESHVVIRKIKETLEKAMNVEYDMMKPASFKEFLYKKTHRGPKSEEDILEKYNGPPIQADPEDMSCFLKEVESTIDMYRSACPNKEDFMEQAFHIRDFIMFQAKSHKIAHFNMRNAQSMYQAQLDKYP